MTDFYIPNVVSYSDYYPGGMQMPGRNDATSTMRYKHQGQESDPEIYGEGNSYAYTYRMSDARLGRFWSIDPLAPQYAYNSPYAYSENRLIDAYELEGAEAAFDIHLRYYDTHVATKLTPEERRQRSVGGLVFLGAGLIGATSVYLVATYGIYASTAFIATQAIEAGIEEFTGVPVIINPASLVKWGVKKGLKKGARELTSEVKKRFSGSIVKSAQKADAAAESLAKKIGGEAQVEFTTFKNVEFDAISDKFIGQAKPGLKEYNQKFRNQAKNTFEAAKATNRKVYYQFDTTPSQKVMDKLQEYSLSYDVELVIDVLKK